MTSPSVEQKIQELEKQQQTLETELKSHGNNIVALKYSLRTKETKQKPEKVSKKDPTSPKVTKSFESSQSKESKNTSIAKPKKRATPKIKRDLLKIEQDFGKIWFVRLGIISLLTGLVFLSNFAYQNFIIEWGPGTRLIGMYTLAVLLLGLGTYFEKAKAALSNYGKVLAAGGMATLYYTSYAAHHIDRLKIIDSPLIGGFLLTASAATCLTYALWKRSEITAVCSIALAFYSTSINPVGAFSLVSAFLLTLTGLILLHRLRSTTIGFISMLGAYLSFIYWQVLVNQGTSTFEHTSWFIIGYWILSTVSILIPSTEKTPLFSKTQLMTFASLNNAFLVSLMSIDFQTQLFTQPLWPVSAVIGSVFIGIACFLQFGNKLNSIKFNISNISFHSSLRSLFLLKGIALITLALCLKLTGPSLALSLTIQSGLILIASSRANGIQKLLLATAYHLILLTGFFIYLIATIENLAGFTHTHLIMATLYLSVSVIANYSNATAHDKAIQRCIPTIFSIFAISCSILCADIPAFSKVIIFLTLNLGLTSYQYLSNKKNILPELCQCSHVFTVIGCIIVAQSLALLHTSHFFAITLILYVLTAKNTYICIKRKKPHSLHTFYLIAATASLIITLFSANSLTLTLLVISLIPIVYHAIYQKFIQYKLLSVATLGFTIYPIAWFAYLVSYIDYFFDTPATLQLIISFIPLLHLYLIRQNKLRMTFKRVFPLLTIATAAMFTLWQVVYIESWELTVALTAVAYHLFDQKENKLLTVIATLLYGYSIFHATSTLRTEQYIISIIVLLPFLSYFCRRNMLIKQALTNSSYYLNTQRATAIIASITLWSISSLHLFRFFDGSALSILWAIIGLTILSIGFLCKDITFRTMAFIILGCTILHVYGVDVWKLNAILRIISFITLGIILLIIGFLYCNKADKTNEK